MGPKYILVASIGDETSVTGYADRPKQTDITALGEGEYTLRREDGAVIKHFTVLRNRNSNLAIVNRTPDGLEGISTFNLGRLVKRYEGIVKLWPAQASQVKKITNEIAAREAVVAAASKTYVEVEAVAS